MDEQFAEKTVHNKLHALQKYLEKASANAQGEYIHKLRVSYKELRAVIRMLHGHHLDIPDALKEVYKAGGILRDNELFFQTLTGYCTQSNCNLPVYLNLLSDKIQKAKEVFLSTVQSADTRNLFKELQHHVHGRLTDDDVKDFIGHNIHKAAKAIEKAEEDKDLHDARKLLKDAMYCLKAVKKEQVYSHKDYHGLKEHLDNITQLLGEHQDISTWMTHTANDIAGLPDAEATIVARIEEQWLDKKQELRNRIADTRFA